MLPVQAPNSGGALAGTIESKLKSVQSVNWKSQLMKFNNTFALNCWIPGGSNKKKEKWKRRGTVTCYSVQMLHNLCRKWPKFAQTYLVETMKKQKEGYVIIFY